MWMSRDGGIVALFEKQVSGGDSRAMFSQRDPDEARNRPSRPRHKPDTLPLKTPRLYDSLR